MRAPLAVVHGFDVGPCAAFGEPLAKGVTVVSAVGQEDLTFGEIAEHVLGAAAIVRLTFGELERRAGAGRCGREWPPTERLSADARRCR